MGNNLALAAVTRTSTESYVFRCVPPRPSGVATHVFSQSPYYKNVIRGTNTGCPVLFGFLSFHTEIYSRNSTLHKYFQAEKSDQLGLTEVRRIFRREAAREIPVLLLPRFQLCFKRFYVG